MIHATITGWGKCLPPAVLSNQDIGTFLETDDAWIHSRTGIRERRISHVPLGELGYVAAARALACAGVAAGELDLIIFGTCSFDDQVPNMASGVQARLGVSGCGAMDINTACTSFLYGLSTAAAMIATGAIRRALVIGGELISPYMDWTNRNVAVLFGDGAAAVVLEASVRAEGLLGERLGCYGDAREILRVHGMGGAYANVGRLNGDTQWVFEGQEIFRKAVHGMAESCEIVLARAGLRAEEVSLVVPHQANLRIIEAVAKRAKIPMERVFVNVERYGNMSAGTVPVALCEALEAGRVRPGAPVLLTGFGAGLTFCAHLLRWGERVTALGASAVELPPCRQSGLELVRAVMRAKAAGLAPPRPGAAQ